MATANSQIMDKNAAMIEIDEDDDDVSTIVDDETSDTNSNQLQQQQHQQRPGAHVSRASLPGSATGAIANSKRQKDISPCYVCGAKAHGYNFDQSSCKTPFNASRRNG